MKKEAEQGSNKPAPLSQEKLETSADQVYQVAAIDHGQTPENQAVVDNVAGGPIEGPQPAPAAPLLVAQASQAASQDLTDIGGVDTFRGIVRAEHINGVVDDATVGGRVFQNDKVVTNPDGSISITFADGTAFSLGSDAEIFLDDLVFNPGQADGSLLVSVLKGSFVFTTGQVAALGPDSMKVTTPAGVLGIRGTQVGCVISSNGSETTCVMLEHNGKVGVATFTNNAGTVVIDELNEAVTAANFNSLPITRILDQEEVDRLFGGDLSLPTQRADINFGPLEIDVTDANPMAALDPFSPVNLEAAILAKKVRGGDDGGGGGSGLVGGTSLAVSTIDSSDLVASDLFLPDADRSLLTGLRPSGDGTDISLLGPGITLLDADDDQLIGPLVNGDDTNNTNTNPTLPAVTGPTVAIVPGTEDGTNVTGVVGGAPFTFVGVTGLDVTANGNAVDLTSGGEEVDVEIVDPNTAVGLVDGEEVFTFTIDPTSTIFQFQLVQSVDHVDPNAVGDDDQLLFQFNLLFNDAAANPVTGAVQITVGDEGPSIQDINVTVNEGDTTPLTGSFLDDPAANIALFNAPAAIDRESPLSSDGIAVVEIVTTDANGQQTTTAIPADGTSTTVTTGLGGQLTVNSQGDFSYLPPPDESITEDTQDIIIYSVVDGDGDSASAQLVVNVTDTDANNRVLDGSLVTSDPVGDQVLLLTLVSLDDPNDRFEFTLFRDDTATDSTNQNFTINEDVGFEIGDQAFLVGLEYVGGSDPITVESLDLENLTVVGSDPGGAVVNIDSINFGDGDGEAEAAVFIFTPSDPNFDIEGPFTADTVETILTSATNNAIFGIGTDVGRDGPRIGSLDADLINIRLGGAPRDTLNGGDNGDFIFGEQGDDNIRGFGGNDRLSGGTGMDMVDGGDGNDVLIGGRGGDTLTGGAGADEFRYLSVADGDPTEIITDFNIAEGDILDFAALFSDTDVDGNPIGDFVRLESDGGNTTVAVDTDGTGDNFAFTTMVTLNDVSLDDVQTLENNLVLSG